jgi:hypothetical protein
VIVAGVDVLVAPGDLRERRLAFADPGALAPVLARIETLRMALAEREGRVVTT